MTGIGRVGAGRVELHRGEALLDVSGRALGREIHVVVVVLTLVVERVQIGVGAEPLVHQAAHQLVDRLVRGLADDVPAGHLEPADDAHHGQVRTLGEAAGIGLAPEALDVVRIVALQIALEDIGDDRHHGLRMERRGIDLADTLDAIVGLQRDEDPIHPADMRRRHRDDVRLHRDDLHDGDTLFLVMFRSVGDDPKWQRTEWTGRGPVAGSINGRVGATQPTRR